MNVLLILFFSTLGTVAVAHFAALHFFWYWKYTWIDMPIHMLGGVSVSLGLSILPFFRVSLPPRLRTLIGCVAIVFIVGVAWEIFEIFAGAVVFDSEYPLDTLTDLCMDVLGGTIGYVVAQSVRRLEGE